MSKSGKDRRRYRDYIELGCVVLCCVVSRPFSRKFFRVYLLCYYESKRQRTPTSRYTSPYLILGPSGHRVILKPVLRSLDPDSVILKPVCAILSIPADIALY
jgi:hypothetical protein